MKTETFVKSTGTVIEVLFKKGGWTSALDKGGHQIKVRNNDVGSRPASVVKTPVDSADTPTVDKSTRSVIAPQYRQAYIIDRDNHNAAGRETISNGDFIATALQGLTLAAVYEVAAVVGVVADYGHLNPGMQRMNLGNRIRKQVRDGAASEKDVLALVRLSGGK